MIKNKSFVSKKVMLVEERKDSITYRVSCSCLNPNCDVWIDFEIDKEFNLVSLIFYKDVYYFDHYRRDILWFDDFEEKIIDMLNGSQRFSDVIRYLFENTIEHYLKNFWYRLKKATRLIFTGYLKMNEDFILMDEDHINNFIKVLEEGRDHIKRYMEEEKRK